MATGFLRMVPDGTYSPANGSVAERMNVIADEIEVLSSSVMGLTSVAPVATIISTIPFRSATITGSAQSCKPHTIPTTG